MTPTEEPLISCQQCGIMDNRGCGDQAIGRVPVQILKFTRKDGYFAR